MIISTLFGLYRRAPFWARDLIGRSTWPLRIAMQPFRVIRVGGYWMALDFMDNASFKYYTDRERYESHEIEFLLRAAVRNPDSVMVDVGANFGAYALAAASCLGRLGVIRKILAIEPDARPAAALRRSVARNGLSAVVEVHQCLAGDVDGEETLFVNARSSADNRTHCVTSAPISVSVKRRIRSVTIDRLFTDQRIPKGSSVIFKLDVQGNEFRVFRGMAGTLSQADRFLVCFEHSPSLIRSAGLDVDEYHRYLSAIGADRFYELTDNGIVRLESFQDFLSSAEGLSAREDKRLQGAVSNFAFARGMTL